MIPDLGGFAYQSLPGWMLGLALALAFCIGASVFSFYMACGSRVLYYFYGPGRKQPYSSRWKEFFTRPSFCDDCETPLSSLALVPVLGYFFSSRHCRSCGREIPAIHPIAELAGGALLVAFLLFTGDFVASILALLFCGHMLVAATTDHRMMILDYENTFLAFLIAIGELVRRALLYPVSPMVELSNFWESLQHASSADWILLLAQSGPTVNFTLTALVAFLLFGTLHILRPHGLGLGDVWLIIPIALHHGMPFVLMAVVLGSLWSILYIMLVRKDLSAPAPLGTFLALGCILTTPIQFLILGLS
ncbi:MAG: prepilin peptidase [Leptospiraceae bacterium]|nr:prepilin peptidase [Leptospiraceae bacterium]